MLYGFIQNVWFLPQCAYTLIPNLGVILSNYFSLANHVPDHVKSGVLFFTLDSRCNKRGWPSVQTPTTQGTLILLNKHVDGPLFPFSANHRAFAQPDLTPDQWHAMQYFTEIERIPVLPSSTSHFPTMWFPCLTFLYLRIATLFALKILQAGSRHSHNLDSCQCPLAIHGRTLPLLTYDDGWMGRWSLSLPLVLVYFHPPSYQLFLYFIHFHDNPIDSNAMLH